MAFDVTIQTTGRPISETVRIDFFTKTDAELTKNKRWKVKRYDNAIQCSERTNSGRTIAIVLGVFISANYEAVDKLCAVVAG